tara:strand:- start:179 stop:2818 length:2640 start_codon:yes stop_codon:yes gene_type:complete
MSKYEFLQPRFTEGVLAKSLQGRSSEDFYKHGYKSSKNMLPLVSGPLVKRPGTNYIGATINSTSRFIPFFKDQDNTYIIEIAFQVATSDCDIRVWSQDQLLKSYGATGGVTTTPYLITTTAWTTLADLNSLKTTQSGDLIFVTCSTKPPQKISRLLATSGVRASDNSVWAVSQFILEDGPYNSVNIYDETTGKTALTLKLATEPVHSTASQKHEIAKVAFNTINNSIILAGHGLQTGMSVRLEGAVVNSDNGTAAWGNLRRQKSHDTSHTFVNASYYVVNTDATSFQVSTTDGGDPLEFELKQTDATNNVLETKVGASITVYRIAFPTETDVTFNIYNKQSTSQANCDIARNLIVSADADSNSLKGRQIRINPLAKAKETIGGIRWAWGIIKAYTANSGTTPPQIVVTLKTELSNTREKPTADGVDYYEGTPDFRLGAFSDSQGWPQVSQIYQQRMVLAANTYQPSTIWLSKTGDFYSFAPSELLDQDTPLAMAGGMMVEIITNSNAVTFTLDSDTLDVIKWLGEGKKLAMGTSAGVYMLYGSETNLTVTPFRFTINRETSFSATDVDPVLVSNSVIYSQIGGKEIQQLSLNKGLGGQWDASKISLKGYDIIKSSTIIKMVWQERPNGIIWCLMADGRLLTLCYDFKLEFMAWSEQVIGGTNAKVLDIALLPKASHDQLWLLVQRTIGTDTVYHVETLSRFPQEGALDRDDYVFSDSAITQDVADNKILSGLSHLNGETVQIYYGGMQHVDKTVANGTITLNHAEADRAVTGLAYTAEIDTLEPSAPANQFSYSKRLINLAVLIEESLGIQLEYNDLSEELLFRTTGDAMGRKIDLFSGTRKLSLSLIGWDTHTVKIRSNGPFPMQINALVIEAETGGS